MKYSSETKTYGSIRTMKSGGAAGVILGLAAVGLAMGTSATTVLADESVDSTATTSVVSEVKEGDIVNDTPTGNASTNLNDPAGTVSETRKADLDNAEKVSGNVSVSVDHSELKKAAEDAKSVGVVVNQDKTEVATATSTAEDTDKALKSITAKESEKANELNSTATKHSTAVAQWTKEKNSTIASNKDLEQAHKKAVEAYNNFVKTLDSETAEVVAKYKDAIIEVTEQVQNSANGNTVEGYQEYLRYLAEHEGLNKEAVKEYLVKKAEYTSKSTANSLVESRNASNSARIELENRKKSNSVSLENAKRSNSAKAVEADNIAKSNSVVEENNKRSLSAQAENDKRSNSAKAVEAENTAKSNSVVEENNKRSLSAKAENEKRSNAAKAKEQSNEAKSNSVVEENNKRSLSAKAENEKRSNAVKAVEADNVVKSNSVVEENKKRSLSADAETARRSISADKETARRSDSAKAENEKRSLAAKEQGTTNEAQRSQQVEAENARRSNSAKEETAKRSQSADAETNRRSLSAKAENERRSLSAQANGAQNDAQRSQQVDAENARRSNSAKEETAKRSLSAEKVKEENTAKSNSVVAENNKRSLSAKAETDRRSQSAAAENERRSLSAKKAAEEASSSNQQNTAIKAYNRAVMEAAGLSYTGNMEQDQKAVDEYNAKLEREKTSLPNKNRIDDIHSTQDTSYFAGVDPRSNNMFVQGWEYVRRARTSYQAVSTADGVSPVTLRWKEGLTTISDLKGGSIESFAEAVKAGRVKEDSFITPPVYATNFTGETKYTPAGLAYKEMTYRLNNAGEMRNVDSTGGAPIDLLVTARAYIPRGYTGPVYNSIGYSTTNAIDINYLGAGGYELILKPVLKGTNISVKGAYSGIISDVDYQQTSHISAESGVTTLNPKGSGLTRDFNHQVFEAPAGGVSDLNDAPSGAYLYTMSGDTIRYVHSGFFDERFKAQNIVLDRPAPSYDSDFRNQNPNYIEFTLFGDWLSIPTTLKSKIILKQPVSPATDSGSYEKVTYEPATYTPVTYEAKPATFTPATYEKLTYTPGQPVPYIPVTYEKATFTPATYEKLTYTPGQPVPYTPVTYEKATYEKATYEPVVFKPQTPPTYVPVTYEKVTYTPEGTEWKPVSYEKEVFSPKNTSWQPVGYEKVTYSPKDTSWTPVPYTPNKFTPEEVPSIPNNPKLVLSKVAMPVSPEYKRVPDAPKAPEVNYHLTSLVVNTPAEKEARNEDGVNINNESVAKGSTNHFILRPKALTAGRPTTTSLVLSDYIADGLELDVKGMTSVNPMYSISYDTDTRKLEVIATEKELANSNADLSKAYSPTAFTVIFRTLNDGATYENVFRMDVNGGNATGSVNVEYRVEGTNVLLGKAKDVVNESVGSSYDTTDHILGTITKDGVTYERVTSHIEGIEKGQVEEGTKLVTYYYRPVTPTPDTGGVVVHYRDEEGNFIKEDHEKVKGGKVGDPYDTTKDKPKEITYGGKTYRLIPNKTVGNETGKITKGITEVTYIYKKVTPDNPKTENTGNVDVEYRVEGTNTLLGTAKDSVNVPVGSDYDTTDLIHGRITKDGVTYERVPSHVDGEEKGKVTKEGKVVVYYYKPISGTPSVGGVIVHYVDEEGNTLKEDKTVSKGEKVGTPYDTTKNKPNEITVEGKVYKLVPNKTVGIENGKVTEGITEVTYVYKQVTPDKPKGNGYTSYSNKVRIHTPGSPNNPNNPNNPNGNGNHKIQPVKNNTNKEGKNINNASVLQNDVNYYVAEWDLDQYINDKSPKSAIARGFGYLENYPEPAVTPLTKDYYAVTSKGEKVEGLDFYEADSAKLNELPEFVQQFIKDSGIDVSNFGKFQVWVAKDSQAFYDKYVKTGQDIFFHLPMAVNKGFTGEFQNQTYQIDFGNGYYGNVVRNNVPNLTPKKDVVVDGKSANGGTITYGQEFSYLLSGAKLPGNRGSHVWEYRYVDDYDQTGDKYLGKYKVVATTDITVSQLEEVKEDTTFKEDVTLEDGTVVKAGQKVAKGLKVRHTHVIKIGEDVTKFTEASHDEANGIITISFKEEFLKSIVDSSEFGADASIDMKRVAYGEFHNKYTNRVNGVDYISNTVKSNTPKPDPEPEKPNTPNKPEQPQLPNTGTQESAASLVGVTLLSALGLAGLSRRKR